MSRSEAYGAMSRPRVWFRGFGPFGHPYESSWCGSDLWLATDSPQVSRIHRGSGVSPVAKWVPGSLGPDHGPLRSCCCGFTIPRWCRLSLKRVSSENLRLAVRPEVFPSAMMDVFSPVPRAHRAAHYMSSMGLWRPPDGPGVPGSCRFRHAIVVWTVPTAFRTHGFHCSHRDFDYSDGCSDYGDCDGDVTADVSSLEE